MTFLASLLLMAATLTSQDAILTLINSPSSTSPERYGEALEIVRREAEEGKPLQQFVYGITTDDQKEGKRFRDSARARIRQMADERGSAMALYLLSVDADDEKLLRRAALAGNIQALNALGTRLMLSSRHLGQQGDTNAVARVECEAFSYFSKAVANRDPNACINIGTCYLDGLGCPVDRKKAFRYFHIAAEAGHPEGMDNLSACYELGHGVGRDERLSLVWRMRAKARRGDVRAKEWLENGR